MLYVLVKNVSKARLPMPKRGSDGRRLVLEPGEEARFTRRELKNPLIARFLGQELKEIAEEKPVPPKVEKKTEPAPVPKAAPKPAPAPEPEHVEEEPVVEVPVEDPEEEVDKRGLYLDAPGITEDNVDDILTLFPAVSDIAVATKEDLVSAGVTRTYAKRLRDWAKEQ